MLFFVCISQHIFLRTHNFNPDLNWMLQICLIQVDRVILVNPATSFSDSVWPLAGPLLTSLPPGLFNALPVALSPLLTVSVRWTGLCVRIKASKTHMEPRCRQCGLRCAQPVVAAMPFFLGARSNWRLRAVHAPQSKSGTHAHMHRIRVQANMQHRALGLNVVHVVWPWLLCRVLPRAAPSSAAPPTVEAEPGNSMPRIPMYLYSIPI